MEFVYHPENYVESLFAALVVYFLNKYALCEFVFVNWYK